MRRFSVLILGLCGFAAPAFAQFTTVTAAVADPSGIPYAGAVMNAILVPGASGGYTLGGQPYSGRVGPVTLDSGGKFTAQFGDVTLITPGSPQWQITIDSAAASVQLPLGTGPQSFVFTSTGTTISGSSPVSLTSALNALAPKLTNFAVGGTVTTTGTPVANQVAEFSSATAITGAARFTDNGTTLSYTGSGGLSVTGGPSIFNNSAGGGALDQIFGLVDRIHVSCNNGSGYRFATIEAGNSDILTNATQGGYNLVCPDNTTDTMTGQVDIGCQGQAACGSVTKTIALNMHPGNLWLDNVSTAHTASWNLHNGSALFGENNGSQGGSRAGGAVLQDGCAANITYGLNTPEGQAGNGQSWLRFEHMWVQGCTTGTVGAGSPSIAAVNIEAVSGMNTIRDNYITGFANTTLLRIASNNNSAASQVGPLHIDNPWTACVYVTGCQPFTIMAGSSSAQGVLPMLISAGASLNPGNGVSIVKINGNSDPGAIFGGHFDAHYTEQLTNASGSLHYDLNDVNNYVWTGGASSNIAADTIFDIKQSAAGRSCNLLVEGHRVGNSGANAWVNHITGLTLTGKNYIPFGHYGGDTSCSVFPVFIEANEFDIYNRSAQLGYQFPIAGSPVFRNFLDQAQQVFIDSGATAAQDAGIYLRDRSTTEWSFKKAGNIARIQDELNTHVHFAAVQNGETDFNAFGSSGIQFNVNNNSVGPPGRFYSGGATSIEIARMDATGNIFLTCHTVTFQNCTEITAPNGAGGASPVVITAPTVSGTMMVTGQNAAQKTQRFGASCTTAASAAATCTSTFSWTTAFADANYTPVCWGEGPAGSPIISLNATQVAASVTVQVQAATAVASSFAGVYCHATHD